MGNGYLNLYMQKKLFSINKISVSDMNPLILYSIGSFLLLLYFVTVYDIIQTVEGQLNMDSFSAKGIIFSRLTESPLLATQVVNNSQSVNTVLNNSNNNSVPQPNSNQNLPFLEGGWELFVQKGEVNNFRIIFTLNQGGKVLDAFAIYNLKTNRFVQLNEKGTEIISGKVDFSSAGLKNGTLTNIDATISITSFTQLRVSLEGNSTDQYLNAPLVGETRVLADANGNILIGPKPPPPSGTAPPPSGTAPPPSGTAPPPSGTAPPPFGTAPPPLM